MHKIQKKAVGTKEVDDFKQKVSQYTLDSVRFTKKDPATLFQRVQATSDELRKEVLEGKKLREVVITIRPLKGIPETRYQCYFVYSNKRGRCYIISFNGTINIITTYPLGRMTLNRYRRKIAKQNSFKSGRTQR